MAKKRQPTPAASKDDEPLTPASKNDQPLTSAEKKDPPPPSKKPEEEKDDEDSTSEEASQSEGEEDGESEDEESEEEVQPPSSQPASKTAPTEKSESNDEDETDTDSDQEPPPKLKSINSKSIDQTLKSKTQPKSSAAPARSGTKRSAENDTKHADETKKSKKKKTTAADDKKEQEKDNKKPGDDSKKWFQRVFTEDDELAILEVLVDFTVKTGTDPVKYPTAIYGDVKKLIHFPVTLEQLKDKLRRLKLKFENKLKSCKNGKTLTFSKPIEEKMFEFGKKIWGENVVEENGKLDEKPSKKGTVKKSPTTKKLEMEPRKGSVSNVFGSGMDLLKSGAELLEESERIEFEKRWKELQIAELEVFKMRAELAEEQGRLILDALMSSSSV